MDTAWFDARYSTEDVPGGAKDGILIDTDVSLKSVEVGGRRAVLCTLRDITGCTRVEESLRQSQEELSIRNRIKTMFPAVPDDRLYDSSPAVPAEEFAR